MDTISSSGAARSVAQLVVEFLIARGVDRVYGLQGGHIQPIWDQLAQRGVRIIDVRDEGAAVHMAHAHAVLAGGVGVALATAGPGRHQLRHRDRECAARTRAGAVDRRLRAARAGRPRPAARHRACGDHAAGDDAPSRTLRVADNLLRDLDKAWSTASGDGGVPGPVYVEIPTDVLRETVPPKLVLAEHLAAKPPRRIPADAADVQSAARAHRPGEAPTRRHRPRRRGCGGASCCS